MDKEEQQILDALTETLNEVAKTSYDEGFDIGWETGITHGTQLTAISIATGLNNSANDMLLHGDLVTATMMNTLATVIVELYT